MKQDNNKIKKIGWLYEKNNNIMYLEDFLFLTHHFAEYSCPELVSPAE